ncbi:hypothetical protein F7Q92_04580 [Ideonella dechloratans]|uniref:Conjugal transfer protein TraN n=1 Tax=Ideonella dechloratans TaxID=36863 RepID=A0A643FHY2_IDEDE|nr:hypothetical protein [Ideonella dechloratans]KAB0584227.1 hypothetical protein F7Q92_04580 [Ideonella dechloratans]UFU08574.1 hypothetical protein LRM40_09455 [Ideonella dechloratans]
MFLRFLLLAALWSPFFAFATNVTPSGSIVLQQTGTNTYAVADGAGGSGPFSMTNRTIGSAAGGAVTVAESYAGTLAGGRISILARRAVPAAFAISMAKESFIVGCQAGTELAAYLGLGTSSSSRTGCNVTDWLYDDGQDPAVSSVFQCDGVPSISVEKFVTPSPAYGSGSDFPSACANWASMLQTAYDTAYSTCLAAKLSGCTQVTQVSAVCTSQTSCKSAGYKTYYSKQSNGSYTPGATTAITSTAFRNLGASSNSSCPAVIDELDPAYSLPAGSPPGPDGKCPTGRYHTISAEDAKRLMEAYANIANAAAVMQKILDKGGSLQGAPERTLTGDPQSVGSPSTTITTNPDGTVTTTTTTPNNGYSYSGNTITVTNNSTTTVTTCTAAGSCTSSTTTKENDDAGTPTDTGMPSVPKLYEQKYPDGVKGVWDSHAQAISQIPLISWVNSLTPSFGNGGCPVWVIPVNVLGINTSGDVSIPCWLWGVLKIIFNISALLAARKLIFGG